MTWTLSLLDKPITAGDCLVSLVLFGAISIVFYLARPPKSGEP